MKTKIFVIKDQLTEFKTPVFAMNEAQIIRDLKFMINQDENEISRNYKDLQLFALGEYESQTGKIETEKNPELIINLIDLKEQKNEA